MNERERRYKAIENRIKAKERWIKLMSILGIIVLIMGMGLLVYNRVAWETRLTLGEPSEAYAREATEVRNIDTSDG